MTKEFDFDVDDRGASRYFRGRNKIIARFDRICDRAEEQSAGTIYLIEGAPGAGKTALLAKLARRARNRKWHVARIKPEALGNPGIMANSLGVPYTTTTSSHWPVSLKIVTYGIAHEVQDVRTSIQVMKEAQPTTQGLLLVLDEAQTVISESGKSGVVYALNAINNGKVGRPVMLLAGGLGNTSQAFGELGIARFGGDCLVKLGRLKSHNERAVIRDWLEKGGHAKQDVTPWVDAIAQETDGWPQHIVSFAQPGSQVIQQSGGRLTDNGLEAVLEEGRSRKEEYYFSRVQWMDLEDQCLLGAFIEWCGTEIIVSKRMLIRVFSSIERAPGDTAASIVQTAIAKGVISQSRIGYHTPIPSMANWLIGRFRHYKQTYPVQAKQLTEGLVPILQ